MNRRARQLGLKNTHYANPIGLDQDGQLLLGARPRDARHRPAHQQVLQEDRRLARRARSRRATTRARSSNRNRLVGRYPFVNGVKTGHTRGAGYVLVGSASRNGVQLVSAVLGTPSEAARDADTMALFNWAMPRFQRIRPVIEGRTMATAKIRFRPAAQLKLVPARTVRRIVPRGHRDAVTIAVHAPDGRRGPDPPRPAARPRRGPPGRQARRDGPADRRGIGPRRGDRAEDEVGGQPAVDPDRRRDRRTCRYGPAGTPPRPDRSAELARRAPHDRHRHAQHGHRQDPVGAQLPARPPPPHGRADDDAGRQGRQRRARAQDARRAGDRHRARRRRDRARGSSSS